MTKRKAPEDLLPRGRPSIYTPEIAARICAEIAKGRGLTNIERDDWCPPAGTVYRWQEKYPEFREAYTRARIEQQHLYVEQIMEIAADKSIDPDRARIMIDARKWIAGKVAPRIYGDKISTEVSGPDGKPIQIEARRVDVDRLDDEQLSKLEETLRIALNKEG
jgi:hypothetical protein